MKKIVVALVCCLVGQIFLCAPGTLGGIQSARAADNLVPLAAGGSSAEFVPVRYSSSSSHRLRWWKNQEYKLPQISARSIH